jgi:hypothetical protein
VKYTLVGALVLALSACSAQPSPPSTPKVSTDQQYTDTVRALEGKFPDSQMLIIGQHICSNIDSGQTAQRQVEALMGGPMFSPVDSGRILEAAVFFLCPKNQPAVDKWAHS